MSPDPNKLDLSMLPPEHRAAFEAMQRRVDVLAEANKRQEALIKELRHALHGKKSEKLTEDERQLAFEDLTIAIGECEAASEEARATPPASRKKRKPVNRNLGNLPEDLPRIEEIIEPDSLEWSPLGAPLVRTTMATWLRTNALYRRGSNGTAGYHPSAAPRDRNHPPQIRLPYLH